MSNIILLDSGPLGQLTNPRPNLEISLWFARLRGSGRTILVPEIADYEVRRELLLAGLTTSLERLNGLKTTLGYLPLSTEVMLRAAELWAEARKRGQPTADPKALDGDVILAAQALQIGAIIATDNVSHLSRFVEARHWRTIS